MTHFLATDENPDGHRLESILTILRADVVKRADKITEDNRPEARQVLENNIRILGLLTECIKLAEDSTAVLKKSFGTSGKDGPRIGRA